MHYYDLVYLRHEARLNLIEWIKVKKLRCLAEETQRLINQKERCQVGVDYKEADQLEYQFRFRKFEREMIPLWIQHGDGLGLDEFSYKIIQDNKNKVLLRR